MLKPMAWANSLAAITLLFYLFFMVIRIIAPTIFRVLFNAQFLGADIASLLSRQSGAEVFVSLVLLTGMSWVVGYVWALLYNEWSK